MVSFDGGDTFTDIGETIDLKIAALKKHQSQVRIGTRGHFSGGRPNGRGRPGG